MSNVSAAGALVRAGTRLDAAAARLAAAAAIDDTYRFRPWGMRPRVHRELDAAATELQGAAEELAGIGGFQAARDAVERLSSSTLPDAIGNRGPARDVAGYRRAGMRDNHDAAAAWAQVARAGAELLADPAVTPATTRAAALEVGGRISRATVDTSLDDLVLLAALDELPGALRPALPMPIAASAVHSIADRHGAFRATSALGSWARRSELLDRPGFDRAAAVDALAEALEHPDPREALRQVAAIDQLPGNVRPDLPHANDWNWTTAHEYRVAGRHASQVDALRARLDDLRASAALGPAPDQTLDEVARVVGTMGDDVSPEQLTSLRDLPGFPPSLVGDGVAPIRFDVVRTRVWLDAQRLASSPGASRARHVELLREAAAVLEQRYSSTRLAGDATSGAALADRLEGPLGHARAAATLEPHDALVRIAAIDMLPAHLRPDLPDLVAVGSRVDAAAHQSAHAFDHARDLLRLQAWLARQPKVALDPVEEAVEHEVERSALRRFLDPSDSDAGAQSLSRDDQAQVLVDVLGSGGSYPPRLVHGALGAAERFLAATTVVDDQVRALVDDAADHVRRNLVRTGGGPNDGYSVHPEYAELGRVAEAVKLVRAFETLAERAPANSLTW